MSIVRKTAAVICCIPLNILVLFSIVALVLKFFCGIDLLVYFFGPSGFDSFSLHESVALQAEWSLGMIKALFFLVLFSFLYAVTTAWVISEFQKK